MQRKLISKLEEWKQSPRRKPLLLLGARQVGKTWLMQEFGRLHYEKVAYIRLDRNARMRRVFEESDFRIPDLLQLIQAEVGFAIEAGKTLLILDEIQECPAALTSLKYFCEDAPELHIMAAGSLLGVQQHSGTGFPVGKVNTMMLYPMSFSEFLLALGKEQELALLMKRDWSKIRLFADRFESMLKTYYYVGGMPEAVKTYRDTQDFNAVREVQNEILADYANDFSKHVPTGLAAKLSMLWNSIPQQLAKENKKFVYKEVQAHMRARDLEEAMNWLQRAGLIYLTRRVNQPALPMGMYEDGAFKVYFLDVGLLAAKSELHASVLLEKNAVFREFKGALAEQYVQQQLRAECAISPHYWHSEKTQTELDFLFQAVMSVVPTEVKAETNTRAKSLLSYCRKYAPSVAVRTSLNDYSRQTLDNGTDTPTILLDIPLYALMHIETECREVLLPAIG